MFNALKYTQELEKAGFTREQAEVSMKLLIDIMNENFATKSDLKELELRLGSKIQGVESNIHSLELKTESGFRETELKFKELEYKLTIKLGTMMTLAVGVTATLVKLLPAFGH